MRELPEREPPEEEEEEEPPRPPPLLELLPGARGRMEERGKGGIFLVFLFCCVWSFNCIVE